jgi:DNA-binding transcriptional ArsR family regulator
LDSFERLLWWVFAGSSGGPTRVQVVRALRERPMNAQQVSEVLQIDYKSIRHHLGVLQQNRIVLTEGDKYGKLYFISDAMESNWGKFESVLERNSRGFRRGVVERVS